MTNPVDTIIVSTLARIDPETQPAHGDELVEAHSRPLRRAVHRGMVTAEYAVGILAAVAFALVLYSVVTDDPTEERPAARRDRLDGPAQRLPAKVMMALGGQPRPAAHPGPAVRCVRLRRSGDRTIGVFGCRARAHLTVSGRWDATGVLRPCLSAAW